MLESEAHRAQREKNPEMIDWKELSKNQAAIHLLESEAHSAQCEKNPEMIDWKELSKNPGAIHFLVWFIQKPLDIQVKQEWNLQFFIQNTKLNL